MGLKVGEVRLEAYNPQWKLDFLQEKAKLEQIFGDLAIKIEHVGSTSVPGLESKPIVDIAVGLKNLTDFEKVRSQLEKIADYSIKLDSDPEEILIRKGPESNRTHFIHVIEINGERYRKTVKIAEILRQDASLRAEYATLKQSLAAQFPHNRKAYSAGKAEFLEKIYREN